MAPPRNAGSLAGSDDFHVAECRVITIPEGAEPADCPVTPLSPLEHVGLPSLVTCVLSFPDTLSVDRMKRAVERLLATFPVLAGRIAQLPAGRSGSASCFPLGIACNNAGVLFRHLRCRRRYYDLCDQDATSGTYSLASPAPEPPYIGVSDVEGLASGQEPLLRVALVHFVDRGSLLSVGMTLGVVDSFNFGRTLRALMAAYRGEPPGAVGRALGLDRATGLRDLLGSSQDDQGGQDGKDSQDGLESPDSVGLRRWGSDFDAGSESVLPLVGSTGEGEERGEFVSWERAWSGLGRSGSGDCRPRRSLQELTTRRRGPAGPAGRSLLHPWWDEAPERSRRVSRAVGRWRRAWIRKMRVAKHCLRIPPEDVDRLRAAAMDGCKRFVSEADALSGLVWLLATSVRKLPTFLADEERFVNVSVRLGGPAAGRYGNATAWIGVRPLRPRVRHANHVPPAALSFHARMAALDDRELNGALGWASYSVRRGTLEFHSRSHSIAPKMASSLGAVGHHSGQEYQSYLAAAFYDCDVHVVHVEGLVMGRELGCGGCSPGGAFFGARNLPPWTAFVTRDEAGGADVLLACSKGEWESVRGHSILRRTLPGCECL
ncbi:unnamed protein product [Ostreobium quekettii]|uniref:Uncharacterized protein n=1 Tax=Ostreobium quekettii TaxID=121088 RepID=A0A8S1J114_9CHLO|nr:unnamed protein product [Ostreobium quekettii]